MPPRDMTNAPNTNTRKVRFAGVRETNDLKFKRRTVSVLRALILTALKGRSYGRSEPLRASWAGFPPFVSANLHLHETRTFLFVSTVEANTVLF